jgi:hypothetical protein
MRADHAARAPGETNVINKYGSALARPYKIRLVGMLLDAGSDANVPNQEVDGLMLPRADR